MKKIHMTEAQLGKLAKRIMNEVVMGNNDTALGATQQSPKQDNGNIQGQPQSKVVNSDGSEVERRDDGGITAKLPKEPTNRTTAYSEAQKACADANIPIGNKSKLTVTTTQTDGVPVVTNGTEPISSQEANYAKMGIPVRNQIPVVNGFNESKNFITKKDILEARKRRLMSESVPYTKNELFGVVAESGKMYNFKFNDGETYRVPGNEVEKFKEYVFEQDGSREGKDYIIEKIDR